MTDQKTSAMDNFKKKLTVLSEAQIEAIWDALNVEISRHRVSAIEAENDERDRRTAEKREALKEAKRAREAKAERAQPKRSSRKIGDMVFRSLDDETLVWVGSGRRPKWLHDAMDRGLTLDDLESTWTQADEDRATAKVEKAKKVRRPVVELEGDRETEAETG